MSELDYKAIFESQPKCLLLLDAEGSVLDANAACLKLLAADSVAQAGKIFHSLLGKDQRAHFAKLVRTIFRGESGRLEVQMSPLNVPPRKVVIQAGPVRDAAGDIRAMLAEVHEISETAFLEIASVAREQQYRTLVENIPDFIVRYDTELRRIYVNPAWEKASGLSAAEVLNKRPSENTRVPIPLVAEYEEKLRLVLATGVTQTSEFKWINTRGEELSLFYIITPELDSSGKITSLLAVGHDLTERKRAEQQVTLLNLALDHVSEAAFLTDKKSQFHYVNAEACRILGYTREELLKLSVLDVDPDMSTTRWSEHWNLLTTQRSQTIESHHKTKDGRVFPIEVNANFFEYEGQCYNLALVRDITERKQSEHELHRLNRELRAISDCNQILLRAVDEQSLLKDVCRIICEEAGYRLAWVGYVEGDQAKTVRPVAWAGEEGGYLSTVNVTWADAERGRGPAGSAIRTGEIVYVQNIATDPRMAPWHETAREHGYCSLLALPLKDKEKSAFGVLAIYSAETNPFTPQEIKLLEDLAGDLAFGIAYLRTQIQHEQAQKALQRSDQNYRAIFNATNEAIFLHDAVTGNILDVNDTMLRMYGFSSKEEVLSAGISDVLSSEPPYTSQEIHHRIRQAIEQGPQVFEWLARRRNGTRFWAEVSLQSSQIGGQGRVLAVVRDSTARKAAEEERIRLSTALDQTAESVVITDLSGMILYVNPAFERNTGYLRREVIGQNARIQKSGQHDAAFYQQMWNTLSCGEIWHGRLINKRKDGRLYTEDATISPVRDAHGKIINYMAIKLDVTREVELEEQFRQVQKLESIGQLAGGVAHDFNNILSSILMQAELMSMTENRSREDQEGLQQIRSDAERAAKLTRQLLLFSRKQVMQPRPLDLNEVVTGLAKMLLRIIGEDIRLQLNLNSTPLWTHADAGMLDQVLMNLAVNARDAMPGGGQLFVETSEKDVDEALAQAHPDTAPGHYVCLNVRDTGSGIPAEILPRIYDPFFTTKEPGKGTGLGLATVFGIVKQHRGWIQVESKPGQGTKFQVFLPAMAVQEETSLETEQHTPPGGNETILLAEDDPAVRLLTRATLEHYGYRVIEAANGFEALGLWPDHRGQVALLLTDLVMPGGVSGLQLARKLQADRPDLKVIYVSGYSSEIAGRAIELRAGENFLQKPFQQDELLSTIRGCLDH